MAQKLVTTSTSLPLADRVNLLVALITPVVARSGAVKVGALVDFGIGDWILNGNFVFTISDFCAGNGELADERSSKTRTYTKYYR